MLGNRPVSGYPAPGGVVIPFRFNSCDVVINQSLLSHLFWAPLHKMASSAPIEAADGFLTTTTTTFQNSEDSLVTFSGSGH
jgi:hypothetical protein